MLTKKILFTTTMIIPLALASCAKVDNSLTERDHKLLNLDSQLQTRHRDYWRDIASQSDYYYLESNITVAQKYLQELYQWVNTIGISDAKVAQVVINDLSIANNALVKLKLQLAKIDAIKEKFKNWTKQQVMIKLQSLENQGKIDIDSKMEIGALRQRLKEFPLENVTPDV